MEEVPKQKLAHLWLYLKYVFVGIVFIVLKVVIDLKGHYSTGHDLNKRKSMCY